MDSVVANLMGHELAVDVTAEICGEHRPEFISANKRAVDAWREQHRQSLELIERNARAAVLRNAHGDKALAAKVQALYHERIETAFRQRYREQPAEFEQICKGFPLALQSDDIDARFATELATLRAHPIDRSQDPGK